MCVIFGLSALLYSRPSPLICILYRSVLYSNDAYLKYSSTGLVSLSENSSTMCFFIFLKMPNFQSDCKSEDMYAIDLMK